MSSHLRPSDFAADKRGCVSADYRDAWLRGRVAWLLETSPRRIEQLAAVRLVVDGDGTRFNVRAVGI